MVAELVKTLKPKALKVDQIRLRILNELRKEGTVIKKEFEKTTATWEGSKPTFKVAIGLTRRDAIVLVGPAGDIRGAQKWVWLNDGTRPHPIVAKNVPNLVFRTQFKPKTKVKVFGSQRGSIKPPWRKKTRVNHPGIEPRDWTGEIAKRRRKPFTRKLIKAAKL